jgi:16S rRNA (guanine966-N2)-methyltransferase
VLRVIAGDLRGRRLQAPPGLSTRPTADRVRESLFDLLGDIPEGARVLDVFAGSGALGIEALSRGARHAVFVEKSPTALRVLRENLAALALGDRATVVPGDAFVASPAARGPFELMLADPPYAAGLEARLVEALGPRLTGGGVLALEHAAESQAPEASEGLAIWKARRYGGTSLTLYVRVAEGDS